MRSGAFVTGSWTDTSPPNGGRTATKVAVWELAENPVACDKPLCWSAAQRLLVPVWEPVDFMGGIPSPPFERNPSPQKSLTKQTPDVQPSRGGHRVASG